MQSESDGALVKPKPNKAKTVKRKNVMTGKIAKAIEAKNNLLLMEQIKESETTHPTKRALTSDNLNDDLPIAKIFKLNEQSADLGSGSSLNSQKSDLDGHMKSADMECNSTTNSQTSNFEDQTNSVDLDDHKQNSQASNLDENGNSEISRLQKVKYIINFCQFLNMKFL